MPAHGLYRGQIGLALASRPGRAEAIISLALRNTRVARLLKAPWRELPLIVYTFVLYIQLSGLSDRESGRFLKKRRKNFCHSGPVALKPARAQSKKVFCFFFQKRSPFLSLRRPMTAERSNRQPDHRKL
jgi:hypothetical protein